MAHPRIVEDLFARDTYSDFELDFDWKISPGGNSGIKYRIQDRVFLLDRPGMKFEDRVNLTLKDRPKGRPERGQPAPVLPDLAPEPRHRSLVPEPQDPAFEVGEPAKIPIPALCAAFCNLPSSVASGAPCLIESSR